MVFRRVLFRSWPPLAAFGSVLLLFLSVSWFGLWLVVPPALRAGGVALFALAGLIALFPLRRLRGPSRAQELARIRPEEGRVGKGLVRQYKTRGSPSDCTKKIYYNNSNNT